MASELEVDIGLTGTGDAVKEFGVSFDGLKFGEGLFLSGVKWDFGGSGIGSDVSVGSGDSGSGVGGGDVGSCRIGRFFAAIFLDAKREKKIGGFGNWI